MANRSQFGAITISINATFRESHNANANTLTKSAIMCVYPTPKKKSKHHRLFSIQLFVVCLSLFHFSSSFFALLSHFITWFIIVFNVKSIFPMNVSSDILSFFTWHPKRICTNRPLKTMNLAWCHLAAGLWLNILLIIILFDSHET